jgi:hypothetical protein
MSPGAAVFQDARRTISSEAPGRRVARPGMKLSTLLYSFSATAMALWLYLFYSGAPI